MPRPVAAVALLLAVAAASAQPPKDPPANPDEQKAKEAFVAGKLDDALKALQAAVKANPALAPPKVILARWCVETGNGSQARLYIEQAAAEDENHPDVLLANAGFALNEGRLTDTILNCRAALQAGENPRWDAETKKRYQREARLGLAAAFEARGDQAPVKTHLAGLLEADPKNAVLRQRHARANFLLDRPEDAFSDLQAAVKLDPTLDPAELTMGQLWAARRDFAKADEWYGKAVAAHPSAAKVQRGLAGYMLDRGRVDAAKAHLAAAKKIDADSRDTRAIEALVARYAKDYAAATPILEALVKDHPSFGFGVANLSLVLADSGDANGKRRAAELAEGFARQNPRSAEARAILGYCLFKAGRAADAEKVVRSAATLGALTPDGAYFLAVVLADRGATEDAHKVVKAACDSKDGFVYRKEGEALLAELDKKIPPPKK